jgi:hypothetical protein
MGLGNDEMLPMTQNDVANGVRVEFQVSMDWGMLHVVCALDQYE